MTTLLTLPADVLYQLCCHMNKKDLSRFSQTCKHINEIAAPVIFHSVEIHADRSSDQEILSQVRPSSLQHVRHLHLHLDPFSHYFEYEYGRGILDYGVQDIELAQQMRIALERIFASLQILTHITFEIQLAGLDDLEDPDSQAMLSLYTDVLEDCQLPCLASTRASFVFHLDGSGLWHTSTWSQLFSAFKFFGRPVKTRIESQGYRGRRETLDTLPTEALGNLSLDTFEVDEVMKLDVGANLTSISLEWITPKSVYDMLQRFSTTLAQMTLTENVEWDVSDALRHEYEKDTTSRPPIHLPNLQTLATEDFVALWQTVGVLQLISLAPTCRLDLECDLDWDGERDFEDWRMDISVLASAIRRLGAAAKVHGRWTVCHPMAYEIAELVDLKNALLKPGSELRLEISIAGLTPDPDDDDMLMRHATVLLERLSNEDLLDEILELSLSFYKGDLGLDGKSTATTDFYRFPNAQELTLCVHLDDKDEDFSGLSIEHVLARLEMPNLKHLEMHVWSKTASGLCLQISAVESHLARFAQLQRLTVRDRSRSRLDDWLARSESLEHVQEVGQSRGINTSARSEP